MPPREGRRLANASHRSLRLAKQPLDVPIFIRPVSLAAQLAQGAMVGAAANDSFSPQEVLAVTRHLAKDSELRLAPI